MPAGCSPSAPAGGKGLSAPGSERLLSLPFRRRSAAARGIATVLCAGILALSCAAGGNAATGIAGLGAAQGRVKSGTGFFVAPAGLLVTSRHVVAGCPGVLVWTDEDGVHDARLIAADARRDLALLAVTGRRGGHAASRYRDDPRRGERVVTVGFGVMATNPKEAVFARGTFVRHGALPAGHRVLIVRADLRPGDSGAPVLDRSGSLLGMVIGRLADRSDLGVVITAGEINRFLSREGIGRLARVVENPRTQGSGAEAARISTLVQCRPGGETLPNRGRSR